MANLTVKLALNLCLEGIVTQRPNAGVRNPFRKPDPYAEKIFGDWIDYFDQTLSLHKHAFNNQQKLPASLDEENKGMKAAKKCLDEYGESDPDAKKHIKWLIMLLQIEIDANVHILEQLKAPDPGTIKT